MEETKNEARINNKVRKEINNNTIKKQNENKKKLIKNGGHGAT